MECLYRFDIDETNFKKEKKRCRQLIKKWEKEGTPFSISHKLPPCISLKKNKKQSPLQIGTQKLLHHNILYGKKYKIMNKKLKTKFLATKCKVCPFQWTKKCRGLVNKKFIEEKIKIQKQIGTQKYEAIKADYANGSIVYGSTCSANCIYCFDKKSPKRYAKKVPPLNEKQIAHFLYYTPFLITYIGYGLHCASGELFSNKNWEKIIPIISNIAREHAPLFTNGIHLNKKIMEIIKKNKLQLCLSNPMLNNKTRKKIMGYKKDFDLKEFVKTAQETAVPVIYSILPLKTSVKNHEYEKTVQWLQKNAIGRLVICKPGTSKFLSKDAIKELNWSEKEMELLIKQVREYAEVEYLLERYEASRKRTKKQIIHICHNLKKNILLLAPEASFKSFKDLNEIKNTQVVQVTSLLKYNTPSAGILNIEDYLAAIKPYIKKVDILIIPRNSFDKNFYDATMADINLLYKKTRKDIILI